MTIERAIEILNPEHREHYDSIETVNDACRMGMQALEKQLPKKPIRANYAVIGDDGISRMLDENEFWKCSSCAKQLRDVELKPLQRYCHVCGQAIDWSGEK